jgi:phosphoglycolate phosphatase
MQARGGSEVSGTPPVSLVCCGLIGTLAVDGGMIDRAYAEAIGTQGVVTGTTAYARCMAQVHHSRGQLPGDVLQLLFPDSQARGQAAQITFDRSCAEAVQRTGIAPVPGAEQVLAWLADAGIRICVISCFSRRVLSAVMETLGWADRLDLVLGADDVPRGFPRPDLALAAMLRLGVTDVRETAFVHCTESGIQGGRGAGAAIVTGVLTGPHPSHLLLSAGATHVIPSIADLPGVLMSAGEHPAQASGGYAQSWRGHPPVSSLRECPRTNVAARSRSTCRIDTGASLRHPGMANCPARRCAAGSAPR